ncbi:ABC transporter permease [Sanguibacter sp. Z1732]|uniref:ABC transporter permease n=1 Tax=Sanguibacter sp. Z1732 TaxID=3435412 RepID=UPI003D9CBE27
MTNTTNAAPLPAMPSDPHERTPAGKPRFAGLGHRRRWPLARHSLVLAGCSLTKTGRNPGLLLDALILPVMFLVLFVYLFGGAVAGSTREYLQYVLPGILVLTTILVGQTATGMNLVIDMKKGIFDQFRALPIGRSAPLIGSVLGDGVRYLVAVLILFGLAFLLGFRVQTGVLSTLAGVGVAMIFGFALSWLAVAVAVLLCSGRRPWWPRSDSCCPSRWCSAPTWRPRWRRCRPGCRPGPESTRSVTLSRPAGRYCSADPPPNPF